MFKWFRKKKLPASEPEVVSRKAHDKAVRLALRKQVKPLKDEEGDTVTIGRKEWNAMLARIEKLEALG